MKFVKAFLKSGTPLSRAEYFRDLFEEVGYPLPSSANMRQLIPFILEQEYECICQEVKGKDVAIIFDGTTRDGEVLVVLVRFVESWTIKQRLVRLRLLKSSVNGDELHCSSHNYRGVAQKNQYSRGKSFSSDERQSFC